ncbi:efflux RND transporter permease subunit, partial [Acidobacteriota bacterium]
AVTEVGQTGLIGICLAVIILFVFLRRIGVTAVISIAIPISVVATFNLMYFNHLTLNIMTLGGLALGAGMLVDNAIVVVENIFRHSEEGKSLKEAAIQGAGEVGGAITSATLTTIIVFLPIVYLHGISGELFKEQAWTVAFSLISSLFVALAVIPMLSSRLLKPRKKEKKAIQSIQFPFYGRILETILKRKWFVVSGAAVLVAVTVLLLPMVGSEFMPQSERNEMMINLQLPEGSSLERTDGAVRSLESLIQENFGEHIEHIVTRVGPSGTALNEYEALAGENTALIHVSLKSDSNIRIRDLMEWTDQQLNDLPGIQAQIFQEQTTLQTTLGTNTAPFVVEIKGKELDTLNSLAEEVRTLLHEIPELLNIETSFQEGRPEINIEVDRTTASLFGLTPQSIGSQLKDLLSGRDVGEYQDEGEFINIVLKTPEPTLNQLEGLLLDTQDGQKIRMDEVTRMVRTTSPREIIRNNQVRTAEVRAHMSGSLPFDQIAQKVETSLDTLTFPPDYSFEVTGEEMLRKESFQSLGFALLLAVILVYMVMAAQFESLRHPFVILLTIPLAGVGAVFLLLILGMPFNIMSFIGIIMLAGIAVNDSIILVDLINQLRRSGQDIDSAIVTAGRLRIRPIFMTSTTTILALLPLTLGIGEGAALRAPLAVAVIGGLITSTLLTLGVIPAVYRIFGGRMKVKQRS